MVRGQPQEGPEPNPPTIIETQQRGLPRVIPGQPQGAQDLILRLLLKRSSEALESSQATPTVLRTQSSDYD